MLPSNTRPLARLVLLSLLLTFAVARLVSILMTLHRMPDIYLHVRDTHIHHLNYGIFLLAGVGAYLLFSPGPPAALPAAAVIYGIGLGLTFDEFGMWLHLNGDYWQRASFDAVIVLAAVLGLAGFAPPPARWRPRQFAIALLAALLLITPGSEVGVASSRIELLLGIVIGIVIAWLYFLVWRLRYSAAIREDAVQRSLAVTAGKVHEQLVPYLPEFGFNPKDARFLGSPVDLIVFDGLAAGDVRRVVFLEVKTGGAPLTARERQVRAVIEAREVAWAELRLTRDQS